MGDGGPHSVFQAESHGIDALVVREESNDNNKFTSSTLAFVSTTHTANRVRNCKVP